MIYEVIEANKRKYMKAVKLFCANKRTNPYETETTFFAIYLHKRTIFRLT